VSLVAGIDYSTHAIDVVLIDEDTLKPEWHRLELAGADAFDRARTVRPRLIGTRYSWDGVLAVGIEEPRGYGAGHLYRIQGAILTVIPNQILVQPWVPSEWRKAVGLKGNASKQDIYAFTVATMFKSGPKLAPDSIHWPQDACDAYCIARATLQALERSAA
jgi:hypothetical protein